MSKSNFSHVQNAIAFISGYKKFTSELNTDLKSIGLAPESFFMMHILASATDQTTTRLADKLGMNLPTATKLIDRLVSDNYVHRKPHPSDRRQIRILLTADGLKKVDEGQRIYASFVVNFKETSPNLAEIIF